MIWQLPSRFEMCINAMTSITPQWHGNANGFAEHSAGATVAANIVLASPIAQCRPAFVPDRAKRHLPQARPRPGHRQGAHPCRDCCWYRALGRTPQHTGPFTVNAATVTMLAWCRHSRQRSQNFVPHSCCPVISSHWQQCRPSCICSTTTKQPCGTLWHPDSCALVGVGRGRGGVAAGAVAGGPQRRGRQARRRGRPPLAAL